MIFAATIKGQGTTAGTFLVTPLYTRIDGIDAPDIEALPVNGLVPANGDVVYCAEGINDFAPSIQLLINENGGAFPLIFASLAVSLVYTPDIQFKGKITLGEGGKKMVLGDDLAIWAQSVDSALTTLAAAVGKVLPAIVASTWQTTNLSENHKLD
jgi:hypothetical protein